MSHVFSDVNRECSVRHVCVRCASLSLTHTHIHTQVGALTTPVLMGGLAAPFFAYVITMVPLPSPLPPTPPLLPQPLLCPSRPPRRPPSPTPASSCTSLLSIMQHQTSDTVLSHTTHTRTHTHTSLVRNTSSFHPRLCTSPPLLLLFTPSSLALVYACHSRIG